MSFKKLFGKKKSGKKVKEGVVISPDQDITSGGNLDRVFKELDCPICYNTCIPPIHSCINGHIICNACSTKVQVCPSCRHGFSGTRNFFAENFLTNCSQPCRFSGEGCDYIRLKGENMGPHEAHCTFRPLPCLVPNCGEHVPYRSLLGHLTTSHKICACDHLPASITFHADQPIINNRKWLPFAITAFGHYFYVMMEVIRPNFWIWVWHQSKKLEPYENFLSQICIKNPDKKLKLMWEGPVQSIRTPQKTIMKEGLCLVAHEVFLQHFNSNGFFNFLVDIKKVERRSSEPERDLNNNPVEEQREAHRDGEDSPQSLLVPEQNAVRPRSQKRSLYDSRILEDAMHIYEGVPASSNPNLASDQDRSDSFISKSSN